LEKGERLAGCENRKEGGEFSRRIERGKSGDAVEKLFTSEKKGGGQEGAGRFVKMGEIITC